MSLNQKQKAEVTELKQSHSAYNILLNEELKGITAKHHAQTDKLQTQHERDNRCYVNELAGLKQSPSFDSQSRIKMP